MEIVSVIAGHEHLNKAAAVDAGLPRDTLDITHTMLDLQVNWGEPAQESIQQLGLDDDEIQWVVPPNPQILNYFSKSTELCIRRALDELRPDQILIYGDLPGSASAAMGTFRGRNVGYPFVHVESGLQTGDDRDIEETGRFVLDGLAHAHTTHLAESIAQLEENPGVKSNNLFLGINPITAILDLHASHRQPADIPGLDPEEPYLIATIHRDETLLNSEHFIAESLSQGQRTTGGFPEIGQGDQEALPHMLEALGSIATDIPVVFIQYGSTKKAIARLGWEPPHEGIIPINSLPFHQYIDTLWRSDGVVTDSSGILVEAAHLGKPAVVLREHTHRKDAMTPLTQIGGVRQADILDAYRRLRTDILSERDEPQEPDVARVMAELQRLGRFLVETANGQDISRLGKLAISQPWIFNLRHAHRNSVTPIAAPRL